MDSDDHLFRRVAGTTLVVTAVVGAGLAVYYPWVVVVNFVLGVAGGLASLGSLAWLVGQVTAVGAESRRSSLWAAGAVQLGKYVLFAAGLYLLLRAGWINAPALAGGVTLPVAVLCLKSVGRRVNAAVGVDGRTED